MGELHRAKISEGERGDLVAAFHKRVRTSADEAVKLKAAQAWASWEMTTSRLLID